MKKNDNNNDVGISYFLNPELNYDGGILINPNAFSLVQKRRMFDELMNQTYYAPLKGIWGTCQASFNFPITLINEPIENGRRTKIFSNQYIIDSLYLLTGFKIDNTGQSLDEIILEARNVARDFRKKVRELADGMHNDAENTLYLVYEESIKNSNSRMSFPRFANLYIGVLTDYIVGLRNVKYILDKSLDEAKLDASLKTEDAFLALGKQIIDTALLVEKSTGKATNSITIACNYKRIIEDTRKDGRYNPYIQTVGLDEQVISHYDVDMFISELDEFLLRHPEFKVIKVPVDESKDYRNLETAINEVDHWMSVEEMKELSGSWEFIPKGSRIESDKTDIFEAVNDHKTTSQKTGSGLEDESDEQLLARAKSRRDFLETTDYLFSIKGKNKFEGYIGYIYPNGVVIFEKLFRSVDPLLPARSNATYAISIKCFIEMSHKEKPEIIAYIQDGGTDVKRIYHDKKESVWQNRVLNKISGIGYSNDVLNEIDAVLKSGVLTKDSDTDEIGGRK